MSLAEIFYQAMTGITRMVSKPFIRMYKRHVLKDEFLLAIKKWRKDKGDLTLRLDYPLSSDSIVFDLGGYLGDYAAAIHEKYGCRVFVYEPVKEFYDECVRRFAGVPEIRCFNYGLSNETGTVNISSERDASSLIKNSETAEFETVKVKDIADEIRDLDIHEIDLIKLNIEGAEFFVLSHLLKNGLTPRIKHIQVQFHSFFPDARRLREDIRQEFAKTHVESWNYPFVWESWTRKKS